jgi:hypothetical protein
MRKISIGIVIAAALLAFSGRAVAQQEQALKIHLDVTSFPTREGKRVTKYIVSLYNTGESEITILTEHLGQSRERVSTEPNMLELTLGLTTEVRDKSGRRIIPSLVHLAPVTLRKNEAAILRLDDDPSPFGGFFDGLPKNGNLKVTYRITEAWGKRLGIWAGSVSSEVFQIKDGQVLPREELRLKSSQ